ncbi:uncharacterized protein BDR25DRAFT_361037 [Lindgomyces ingoldianus]|uniref:Uncharacterized protein n=1 Tax=Lindgomyces ingoldianus TaxID=673940 RepID=A0ACB6QDZ2_9PLEO|nr:uncharacterized protein BDR25DRAFT_361037 [Lindgomyces ingoldianus]KAF2465129.1 hypothetical protein BDR25DRAFT_361037 [Lindgomyces ingoldianus]
MRYESTQRHMGALYVGYQKTTELATGASRGQVEVGADTGAFRRIESGSEPIRGPFR